MKDGESYKASLYRQYHELGLKIALLEMKEEEARALEGEISAQSAEESAAQAAFFARTQKDALRKIDRRLSAKGARDFARHTLPRAAQVAACLLLVANIGVTTAVAAVPSVRVKVLNFLINIEEQYAELSLVEDEQASFVVPTGWTGSYYPSYVPEGFEATYFNEYFANVYFENQAGNYIDFSELDEDSEVNIDTEESELTWLDIRGSRALCAVKEKRVMITWSTADCYFILDTDLDKATAIDIARGVIKIK